MISIAAWVCRSDGGLPLGSVRPIHWCCAVVKVTGMWLLTARKGLDVRGTSADKFLLFH